MEKRPINRPRVHTAAHTAVHTAIGGMTLFLLLGLTACGSPPDGAGEEASARLAWLADLPAASAPEVGSAVWAAPPLADGTVQPGAYEVVGGDDRGVELIDSLGNRFAGVPPALMRPRRGDAVQPDDIVLAEVPGNGLVVARAAEGKAVRFASNGQVVEVTAVELETLESSAGVAGAKSPAGPAALGAFRPAAYRDEVGWQKGLALASSPDRVWLFSPDGRVVTRPRSEVVALEIAPRLETGGAVFSHSWARGFEPGVVVATLEPGLLFRVESGGVERICGFDQLIVKPAPWPEAS